MYGMVHINTENFMYRHPHSHNQPFVYTQSGGGKFYREGKYPVGTSQKGLSPNEYLQ